MFDDLKKEIDILIDNWQLNKAKKKLIDSDFDLYKHIKLTKIYHLQKRHSKVAHHSWKIFAINSNPFYLRRHIEALVQQGKKFKALELTKSRFQDIHNQENYYDLLSWIYQHFDEYESAEKTIKKGFTTNSEKYLTRSIEILLKSQNLDLAAQNLEQLQLKFGVTSDLLKLKIRFSRQKDFWQEVLSNSNLGLQKYGDPDFLYSKFSGLINLNRFEEAKAVLSEITSSTKYIIRTLGLHVELLLAQFKFEEAQIKLDQLLSEYPEVFYLKLQKVNLLINGNNKFEVNEGIVYLESLIQEYPESHELKLMQISTQLKLGKFKLADKKLSTLNEIEYSNFESFWKLKTWQSVYVDQNLNEANEHWDKFIQKKYYSALHAHFDLKKISTQNIVFNAEDIVCIMTAKNEALRLPYFLDYYRRQGITNFIIIDNNSTDQTQKIALKQPDCFVFESTDSYAKVGFGMRWVNHLVDKYGNENWFLYVDPDEFLVLPLEEEFPIKKVTRYMDSKGQTALFGFMLDMFADKIGLEQHYTAGQDPLQICNYFDNSYSFFDSSHSPYKTVLGGFRNRMFNEKEPLNKTPLIKANRNIKFIYSSHMTSPTKICDISGVLLHFKFLGNTAEVFEKAAFDSNRYKSGRRYLKYNNLYNLSNSSRANCLGPDSIKYTGIDQLKKLNLVREPL